MSLPNYGKSKKTLGNLWLMSLSKRYSVITLSLSAQTSSKLFKRFKICSRSRTNMKLRFSKPCRCMPKLRKNQNRISDVLITTNKILYSKLWKYSRKLPIVFIHLLSLFLLTLINILPIYQPNQSTHQHAHLIQD